MNRHFTPSRRAGRLPAAGVALAVLALALLGGGASTAFADETPGAAHEGGPHAASTEAHAGHGAAGAGEVGEHGAGEHAPSIDPKKLALQLLNFGVLLFILVKFGGKAINKALAARHQQLKADLAAAAELRATAEAKLAKHEARLVHMEQEIAQMRLGLKADAEAEKAQLIAAAEERAQRIKAETAFLMEQQVREAGLRLRRESADAALNLAREILRQSVGPADQQRMLDTFVSDVEKVSPVADHVIVSSGGGNGNGSGGGNGNGSGREQASPNGAGRAPAPDDAGRIV